GVWNVYGAERVLCDVDVGVAPRVRAVPGAGKPRGRRGQDLRSGRAGAAAGAGRGARRLVMSRYRLATPSARDAPDGPRMPRTAATGALGRPRTTWSGSTPAAPRPNPPRPPPRPPRP